MTGTGKVIIETLQRLVAAFNAHDLDAVMGLLYRRPRAGAAPWLTLAAWAGHTRPRIRRPPGVTYETYAVG